MRAFVDSIVHNMCAAHLNIRIIDFDLISRTIALLICNLPEIKSWRNSPNYVTCDNNLILSCVI